MSANIAIILLIAIIIGGAGFALKLSVWVIIFLIIVALIGGSATIARKATS